MAKKMQIILNNRLAPLTEVYVDGKKLTFKKIKKSRRFCAEVETDNDGVELVVKKYTLLQFRLWWFWEILFNILSVFGLFDIYGGLKNVCQAACRVTLPAEDGKAYPITVCNPVRGKQVVRYNNDPTVEVKENLYYLSPAMAKRQKGLKVIKILCPILTIIAIALIIIL